ncbi:MAG: nuclear transport factor 2 family protein [Bacteroidota bacterium]
MKTIYSLLFFLIIVACKKEQPSEVSTEELKSPTLEQEKTAILATINSETVAAFSRDYDGWQNKWIQEPFVTKTYMQFPDSSITETLGWKEISGFVKTYFEEHPEPDPLPKPIQDIEVRVYGTGAWVTYEQVDSVRGLKRETRLMEKVDGMWKIAGMHTTIYGKQAERHSTE